MKLQLVLTKREIEALKAVAFTASADADAMISESEDKSQMKNGYQIEEGVAILEAIIELAERIP